MDLAGRSVTVMGLGRFGGGIGVTRWLVERSARVTVTDQAEADALHASIAQLEGLPVTFRLGGHEPADLDGCELLVVSPAVHKARSPFVQEAVRRGIALSSEMNLFVERCRARRIVGVTGSAGKSTTTAMLGTILAEAAGHGASWRSWVGGNIGRSLLADLDDIGPDDVVVLELSSFQLEDLAALAWSPSHALITNLQPNHLDRHGTFEAYADAKMNIVRYQSAGDEVFVHADDDALGRRVTAAGGAGRLVRYRFDPGFADVVGVPGRHNQANAAAAIAVARSLGAADEVIRAGLAQFAGLPHRLEFVGQRRGVRFYNDSKSTTPESTCLALEAFDAPVILLVGGADKGMSFDALVARAAACARGVVCYGRMGPVLHAMLQDAYRAAGPSAMSGERLVRTDALADAVQAAADLAEPGNVVVLSPACTSYDQFANYQQRGETFARLVRSLPD